MSKRYNKTEDRFKEIQQKFTNRDCILLTSFDDWKTYTYSTKLEYKCNNDHISHNLLQTFENKKYACNECFKITRAEKTIEKLKDILSKNELELISYDRKTRKLVYKCKCGEIANTCDSNIRRKETTTNCIKCQENPFNNSETQEKIKQNNIDKYGVDNPSKRLEIKEKIKSVFQEKYGVDNIMHHNTYYKKCMNSQKSTKKYTFPSGKTVLVQGYEPRCINLLLKSYKEKDIVTGFEDNIPIINYTYNGKRKKYTPDIYIEKENLIIEVKSSFTFSAITRNNNWPELNYAKALETVKQGYNYKFYIFDKYSEEYLIKTHEDLKLYIDSKEDDKYVSEFKELKI